MLKLLFLFHFYVEMRTIYGDVSSHYWESPYSQPYFDNSSRREVTAIVGQAALLQCRVRNLGDRAVSNDKKCIIYVHSMHIRRHMFCQHLYFVAKYFCYHTSKEVYYRLSFRLQYCYKL